MLELIVLGQIPGTHIQITFAWYLFAALGIIAYLVRKVKRAEQSTSESSQLSLF